MEKLNKLNKRTDVMEQSMEAYRCNCGDCGTCWCNGCVNQLSHNVAQASHDGGAARMQNYRNRDTNA